MSSTSLQLSVFIPVYYEGVNLQPINAVRSRLLNDGVKNTGCGLKVFYRDNFLMLPAFDHMHRFLPALVQRHGGIIATLSVNHRSHRHGLSKHGINNRLWVDIVDLFGVMWRKQSRL